MNVRLDKRYVLGDYRLEPDRQLLLAGDQPVRLAKKPFLVLLYLVEHRERYVSTAELLERFWPGKDVYDDTVRKAVAALRRALGEQPGEACFIETRWGYGYRYVGPFAEQAAEAEPPPPKQAETSEALASGAGAGTQAEPFADEGVAQQPNHVAPAPLPAARLRPRSLALLAALLTLALATVALVAHRGRVAPLAARQIPPPPNSVAVLPLKNLTGEPANDYLCDGLTGSLINALTQIRGLKVSARGSAFSLKGQEVDARELGQRLGVATLLQGGVFKDGERLRVEVRLVGTEDGRVLWAGAPYDRKLDDIFALQDDIARNVVGGLEYKLGAGEEQRLTARHTESVAAYQAYLKARYFLNKRTPEGITKAIEYFQQAIALDANYALAYAGLAETYDKAYWFTRLRLQELMAKENEAAAKALALDDSLAEAHVAMATVYANEWRLADAAREEERAIEINPSNAEAHHNYAYRLIDLLRPDEAVAEIKRARELDPLNSVMNVDVGQILTFARRYDEAIEALREAVEMEQGSANAHWNLGAAYELKGMYAEAVAEYAEAYTLLGEGRQAAELKKAYESGGIKGFWRKRLEQLTSRPGHDESTEIAILHANLGDKDQAFAWLEKSYQERSPTLVGLKSSPWFDALRPDPRYTDLLRRTGLP